MPAIKLSKVVFPAALGPTSATTLPAGIDVVIDANAGRRPKDFDTAFNWIAMFTAGLELLRR